MKPIRIASIVLAAAGTFYDWRVGAATIVLLGLTCEWLLRRIGEQKLLLEITEMRAIRDSLTGVYNRRWLEETSFEAGTSTGVIVADVDHFKSYNDRWGHAGGDALLQQLARLMRRLFGNGEVVCRTGGEEFLIIIPHVSFEALRERAEGLVEESRRLTVQFDGELLGGITVSAGIAIAPHHATTIEGLIAAADRALYAAKSGGRDRVATPPHQVVAGRDAA
jgi:diguanylate cyclase (GGDEF)-like protein